MIEFNKKLIFKKIFIDITNFFLLLLISLAAIVWVMQAVNFLDFVTEDGHGLFVYFSFTALNLPKIISRLIPIIFFISVFYIINKYEDNNELKIYWLSGIKRNELTNKIIKFSLMFSFLLLMLNVFLVPFTQNKARTFIQSSNIDFFPSLIREKKFIDTVEGLTIFIENKVDFSTYENIFLKDNKGDKIKIIYAKSGKLINNESERSLRLVNGKIININNNNITEFEFNNTTFDLNDYITKSITDFKVQEKNTYSLISCYLNFSILKKYELYYDPNNCNDPAIKEIRAELFKRIIKPLYLILLSLTSCFLLFFSKENKLHKRYRVLIFLLGIIFIVISELSNSFSGKGHIPLIVTSFIPIGICLMNFWIINKYNNLQISK